MIRSSARRRGVLALSLALVAVLMASCGAEPEAPAGEPSSAATVTSGPTDASLPPLVDGPVTPGRYVVMPPAVGWAECASWVTECPPEPPLARSLRVAITIPPGWEAGMDATVLVPPGLAEGSSEGPDGSALVIGWTTPTAGLHSDPCQPASHLPPDIPVGPTVDDFVDAVLAHLSIHVSEPVDVELGGYRGTFFRLTAPSDISDCYDWRPFEPGIFAQGPNNLWSVWVIDIDGFRMIVLTQGFPGTPAKDKVELRSMVESIRFLP